MKIMNNFSLKVFIAVALACSASSQMVAQDYIPTPVTISTSKTKVNGKVCYQHVVLERQTVYSICKAYGVTAEDLYKYNAGLQEKGLKKNTIILIPSQEALAENAEKEQKVENTEKAEKAVKAEVKTTGKKLRKHTVKWYETLEDIAKKYGVSEAAIIELNNIQDPNSIARMKLLIPETESSESTPVQEEASEPSADGDNLGSSAADTTKTSSDLVIPERIDSIATADTTALIEDAPKTSVNFAVVLPFAATGTTSKANYMDFYSGVLYAIYKSCNTGIETDLRVFDCANDAVPDPHFFNGCDFVIGPVYEKDLKNTMSIVPEDLTVISPLDHRTISLTEKYPNLIQAPTHRKYQYEKLVNWLKSDLKEDEVVLYIHEENARDTASVREMTEVLDSSGVKYVNFSYPILKGRDIAAKILTNMTRTGNNRVIIDAESEAWVTDLVRNLSILQRRAKITLYSPSKIRSYDAIDAEILYSTLLHVCMSYNINYDTPEVKDFLLKYRAIFHTEPSLFAFQGYDLATYFINLVHTHGNDWKEMLTKTKMSGLQTDFDFHQAGEGKGLVNEGVRKTEYFSNGKSADLPSDFEQ